MRLQSLLASWKNTPQIAENIAHWQTIPPRQANQTPLPADLHPDLAAALRQRGVETLYAHQAHAWERAGAGCHLVLATGTASGKTLAYNLPILDRLLRDETARALYLFPTKALAQDQLAVLRTELDGARSALAPAIYDGDTPRAHRPAIRQNARLILTNPDMLHFGVLPYHPRWAEFFRALQFVVIDEMHVYRGVFGSHVANVLRRLKRIAAFYGAAPQFILTSATIANPLELAEKLIEAPLECIAEDGSARGAQHFLIYNPPIVNEELGIRRSLLQESVSLTGDLLAYDVQTLLFGRSRRAVELMLRYLRAEALPSPSSQPASDQEEKIRSYRSGYLPAHRRAIERGLRAGTVRAVAATNALELGIDLGGMGAVVLAGYPGSIAAAWQQAGRAGRGSEESLAVLLASASPLDQYLARHPEYFFSRSPEAALIHPDNPLILLDHLRCAVYELPFTHGEGFGRLPGATIAEYLDFLAQAGEVRPSRQKFYWTAPDNPARNVSLRAASARRIVLQVHWENHPSSPPATLGEIDGESAVWMAHPGAIYLHEAETYLVDELDLQGGLARLRPIQTDYYTEPQQQTEISLVELRQQAALPGGVKSQGAVLVTSQVTGYRKLQWLTQQRLADEPLDLPPTTLQTAACWLTLSAQTVDALRDAGLWRNDPNDYGPDWLQVRAAVRARDAYRCQACGAPEEGRQHDVHHKIPFRAFPSPQQANRLENLITLCPACHRRAESAVRVRSGLAGLAFILSNLAPLYLMCDPSDLRAHADPKSPLAGGQPTVVLYERIPAGIGLTERLFEVHQVWLAAALELVEGCPCADGCPSCVGPGGQSLGGERAWDHLPGSGGKAETRALLEALAGRAPPV